MNDTPSTALIAPTEATAIEQAVINGNLAALSPAQRVMYYKTVCESVGLNPFTRPFDYITLNGKLTLYAKKDATDQLRNNRKVNITKIERERMEGIYVVTAYAATADGRSDASVGAVSIEGLRGDALANAIMKAETKAKRRVTLSICGMGILDETEIETIPGALLAPQTTVLNGDTAQPPPGGFDAMTPATSETASTTAQRKTIFALANKLYGTEHMEEQFRPWLLKTFGTDSTKGLSIAQAGEVITLLKQALDEQGPA